MAAAVMTSAGWIALAITIFGAFAYAAASILQAVGARRSTSTVQTLGHPLYIVGTVCDLLAWAGSMIALRELAVYLVESVLAGSLAITVVAARVFLASRLRRRDAVAIVVTVAALTVLAMSAGPQQAVVASPQLRIGFCVAAVATALIGWISTKVTGPGVAAGLAGLALGAAALCGRALALPPDATAHPLSAVLAVVTEPMTGALVVFAVTGMLLYANALQRGDVGPVTAVLWIAEVIAPSAMALLMLGDTVRPGWSLAATIAGLVTVAAAVLLASAPANNDTAVPSADGTPAPPVLPPAPIPVSPKVARGGQRIIWWGPPPVWVPPLRPQPSVQARPAAASLTSAPGHAEPHWRPPRPADADSVSAGPVAASTGPVASGWVTEDDQPASRAVPRPRWMSELDDLDVDAAFSPSWAEKGDVAFSAGWAEDGDAAFSSRRAAGVENVDTVLSPHWMAEAEGLVAPGERWISELDGETPAAPPEWPPRHPASMTFPVEQRPAPRSPWHDL